jgi:hypothetical protein
VIKDIQINGLRLFEGTTARQKKKMRGPLVAPHVKQRNLIDVSIFLRKIEQEVVEHSKQQVIAIAC